MMITAWDGTEYDTEKLLRNGDAVKSSTGTLVYLTQTAYVDGTNEAPIYRANGVDEAGNQYQIEWEKIDFENVNDEDVCDWENPYRVEIWETVA